MLENPNQKIFPSRHYHTRLLKWLHRTSDHTYCQFHRNNLDTGHMYRTNHYHYNKMAYLHYSHRVWCKEYHHTRLLKWLLRTSGHTYCQYHRNNLDTGHIYRTNHYHYNKMACLHYSHRVLYKEYHLQGWLSSLSLS